MTIAAAVDWDVMQITKQNLKNMVQTIQFQYKILEIFNEQTPTLK